MVLAITYGEITERRERWRAKNPPQPKYALALVRALNLYFAEFGEYPPYLLGGLAKKWKLPDPLIDAGILDEYPLVEKHRCGLKSKEPIENIVSTPNDPYVEFLRKKYKEKALAEAARLEALDRLERDPWLHPKTNVKVSTVEKAFKMERFLCAGGVRISVPVTSKGYAEELVWYNTYQFSDGVAGALELGAEHFRGSYFSAVDSEFGYQRGEFLGEDNRSCWIWFYAKEPLRRDYSAEPGREDVLVIGLDLVDPAEGLIRPDGIPDGVVLLYKLKEGKVVEVVKKYD